MIFDDFLQSVQDDHPPEDLPETLASLWWDRKGDWDKAHFLAQNIATRQGSAVHAYLHREEGVLWNADDFERINPRQGEKEYGDALDHALDWNSGGGVWANGACG